MKKSHFTLSRKHMRRPNMSREGEEETGFKGIRRVDTLNSRPGSSRRKMATLSRAKATLKRSNTLRAFGKLSSNIFHSNKSFRKGLSFTEDDPTETETLASDGDSIHIPPPIKKSRTLSRKNNSVRSSSRSKFKQGTLFRKKKVKKVTAESEYRLSQIVVTPLNQESAFAKPAGNIKDASTDSFEIRASFKDTMRHNSGPEVGFEEARRFLLQSAKTLPGNSSQGLKQPMLSPELAEEFEDLLDSPPPPPPPRSIEEDSSRPFLPAEIAEEFAELRLRPIPSLLEMLPPAPTQETDEIGKPIGLSNQTKHTDNEITSDSDKNSSELTRDEVQQQDCIELELEV